jgi:hypothetical protein
MQQRCSRLQWLQTPLFRVDHKFKQRINYVIIDNFKEELWIFWKIFLTLAIENTAEKDVAAIMITSTMMTMIKDIMIIHHQTRDMTGKEELPVLLSASNVHQVLPVQSISARIVVHQYHNR